jgi:shikimate dehydrogenase
MIKAAVLGSPISHSLSPILHRRAYKELSIDGEYQAIEVKSGNLSNFISGLDSSWTGFSLTMPLKEEVLQFATEVDELARQIDSANTLVRVDSGWRATSTDVNGFNQALQSHGITSIPRVLILGSGATARAAAAACNEISSEIIVIHRSESREVQMLKSAPATQMRFVEWGAPIPNADLIVNTTPAGVADIFVGQIPPSFSGTYFEALYHPWPTLLLKHFRELGHHGIDGLDLLVHQGIDQVALMTGKKIDRERLAPILRKACLEALNDLHE